MTDLYQFVFRGLLAEQALDRAGRQSPKFSGDFDIDVAKALSIDVLDEALLAKARRMAAVYTAIAAFENSARKLLVTVLSDKFGASWWQTAVSEKIRNIAETRIENEEKVKWHTQRGQDPINYTDLGDLIDIMRKNWLLFEPYVHSLEWAEQIFKTIERSRNVIMHSGVLGKTDIERIGTLIRDWARQVAM